VCWVADCTDRRGRKRRRPTSTSALPRPRRQAEGSQGRQSVASAVPDDVPAVQRRLLDPLHGAVRRVLRRIVGRPAASGTLAASLPAKPVRWHHGYEKLSTDRNPGGHVDCVSRPRSQRAGWCHHFHVKAVRTSAIRLQYNCNTRIFLALQLYCTCTDPCCSTSYKFSATCRKLAGYLQQL